MLKDKSGVLCGLFWLVFLILAATGFVMAAPGAWQDQPHAGLTDLVNGRRADSFSDSFDDMVPHRPLSLSLWGAVAYGLFKEGRAGVLIGTQGWLFTDEEFQQPPDFAGKIARSLAYIREVDEELSRRGVKLLVVPVPAKARIYQDKLGRYVYPALWVPQYQAMLRALRKEGVAMADLAGGFAQARRDSGGSMPLFLKTDTHWSPQGARIAARLTGQAIAARWPQWRLPGGEYIYVSETAARESVSYQGDLMRYIPLGGLGDLFGVSLTSDAVTLFRTRKAGGVPADLFGTPDIPVTLVGTSYSADSRWNFAGFLKEELQADVLNMADPGLGPFEVMRRYLQSDEFYAYPPHLVVWEVPERYLAVPLNGTKERGTR